MKKIKKYIKPVIIGLCLVAVLAVAYFSGGEIEKDPEKIAAAFDNKPVAINTQAETDNYENVQIGEAAKETAKNNEAIAENHAQEAADISKNTAEAEVPEIKAVEPEITAETNPAPVDEAAGDKEYTCTLTVRCDTILNNLDKFDEFKVGLIPGNGVIFESQAVTFYEGESVFDVLLREMKKNKIHMEFVDTPMLNTAYIEGINNIYEFDCGELSGWMYRVNGQFPNYGCSQYQLKDKDVVEWVYTCDLGKDVGGGKASTQQLQ